MTQAERTRREARRTNRAGEVIAVLVDAAGLVVLNAVPGWQQLPLLTEDFRSVLGIVNASLAVGIVVNLVLLLRPGWPTAAGSLVTTIVGLVAMVRVLQVFPFDLSPGWTTVVRVLLVLGVIGSAIGVLAVLVSLLRLRRVEER